MNIEFPVILYLDGKFAVFPEEGFKVLKAEFLDDDDKFITRCITGKKEKDSWIIDSNGRFISLSPTGRRNEWATSFAAFLNLVKSEYAVKTNSTLDVRSFLSLLDKMPAKEKKCQQVKWLVEFLEKQDENRKIDRTLLEEWPI